MISRFNKTGNIAIAAILLLTTFLQSGCVNHAASGDMDSAYSLVEYKDLNGLKRQMVLCATQYMLMNHKEQLYLSYKVHDQKVSYETTDKALSKYMLACTGIVTFLPQDDSGTIEIAGR
ncbi:hypothetical protein BTJ39_03645 [Izhakiella australiensis]|uniref:Uncharacterized protein n=1 Tax=Izhakiella australiensis TaxID=1926881 RepID=A0A1S8YPT8_9GAMM|nr:hypothetical protein [Izhakiella australiensis]OON41074.1 hypothetical protein BTJ39_03645 [Izhakiella australiensis]